MKLIPKGLYRRSFPWLFILLSCSLACTTRVVARPAPSPYEEGLGNFQKGELLAAIQKWEKAEPGHPRYEQTREMIGVANNILFELVTLHLQCGGNLQKEGRIAEALKEYQRALMLDPRRKDIEDDIRKVQEILAPLVKYHLDLAQEYEGNGRFQQALDEIRLVTIFDPDNVEARYRSVQLEERIGSAAEDHYKTGLRYFQEREYRSAQREMASVVALKSDHEGARGYLREIDQVLQAQKKVEARSESPFNSQLRERRARVMELKTKGDWVQVRKETKSLLEIDPYDSEAKDLLMLAEVRCRDRADLFFQEGIRSFQEENLDLAISYWMQVLSLDAGHEKAREYLGKASLMREKIRRIKGQRIEPAS